VKWLSKGAKQRRAASIYGGSHATNASIRDDVAATLTTQLHENNQAGECRIAGGSRRHTCFRNKLRPAPFPHSPDLPAKFFSLPEFAPQVQRLASLAGSVDLCQGRALGGGRWLAITESSAVCHRHDATGGCGNA
jgi:hypothetical protein